MIADEAVGAINGENKNEWEWGKMEITIDSGAAESVSRAGDFPMHEVLESPGSRFGLNYVAANGTKTPNKGMKKVEVFTNGGLRKVLTLL